MNLAAKSDLASLKAEVDKLAVDKFRIFPVDFSKRSNVMDNEVFQKAVFDELAADVSDIDTS